jgi:CDP-6-deoxy-D-xylo-4-hexulose-3-dehydrase
MIKLIKSSFYHEAETKRALTEFILSEDILSMNKECRKFEEAFAAKQERKYAVFVSNGSVANLLLIQALLNLGRLNKGDNVGFSALTWPTNVMPLIQLGLNPVAIDCNLETLNVSPENLNSRIKDIEALFLTNVLGFCDDIVRIKKMCDENDVILLEDNCESLGSKVNETLLGNFGVASTFSFFVGHHMSTIEGGMVCTDDEELHDYLVMARAHGWDRNLSPDKQQAFRAKAGVNDFYAKYTFYDIASNFRPTEINGFIGNTQIKYWDEIVQKRVVNFKRFQGAVDANEDFYHYDLSHMQLISNFSMPIICKTSEFAKHYREKFEKAEAEIRPIIAGNMTKQPFYKKYVKVDNPLPYSDLAHENGFYFGNNPEMTEFEVDTLCNLLMK